MLAEAESPAQDADDSLGLADETRELLTDAERVALRAIITRAAIERRITPAAIFAYAKLHLVTDDGRPIEPAPLHEIWAELLCSENIRRLLILAPPEMAKTTWVISAYCGLHIGLFPQRSIIIGSASGGVAGDRVLSLRTMVETPEWKKTFPTVQKAAGMHWEPYKFSVAPYGQPYPGRIHPTAAAYGPDGSITGSRGHTGIGDDIVDERNSRTQAGRRMVSGWIHKTFIPRVHSRRGLIRMIGTAWHPADAYSELAESGEFVVCRTPLLSESESVYAEIDYPDGWQGPVLARVGDRLGWVERESLPAMGLKLAEAA